MFFGFSNPPFLFPLSRLQKRNCYYTFYLKKGRKKERKKKESQKLRKEALLESYCALCIIMNTTDYGIVIHCNRGLQYSRRWHLYGQHIIILILNLLMSKNALYSIYILFINALINKYMYIDGHVCWNSKRRLTFIVSPTKENKLPFSVFRIYIYWNGIIYIDI